jgi:WD40 repeat protein
VQANVVAIEDGRVVAPDLFRFDLMRRPVHPLLPAIAVSPDGALLLVGIDGQVTLYRLADRRPLWNRPGEGGAFSPEGRLAAVAGEEVVLVDVPSGAVMRTYATRGHAVTWSREGNLLLVDRNFIDNVLLRFDGRMTKLPAGHALVSPTGDSVMIGPEELYSASGTFLRRLGGPTAGTIRALAFTADGTEVLALGGEAIVRHARGGLGLARVVGPGGAAGAFSADARLAAVGGEDHNQPLAQVVRVADGTRVPLQLAQHGLLDAFAFSPDNQTLAIHSRGYLAFDVYRLSDGAFLRSLPNASATHPAFAPDGRLALVTRDEILRLYDTAGVERQQVAIGGARGGYSPVTREGLAFSPDGRLAVLGRGVVIDLSTGVASERLPMAGGSVVDVSPVGGWLALFKLNGWSSLGESASPLTLARAQGSEPPLTVADEPTAVAFSRDGATLAVGRGDGTIGLYCRPD